MLGSQADYQLEKGIIMKFRHFLLYCSVGTIQAFHSQVVHHLGSTNLQMNHTLYEIQQPIQQIKLKTLS